MLNIPPDKLWYMLFWSGWGLVYLAFWAFKGWRG